MSLGGLTPSQAAGIQLPFNDGWGNLIAWATVYGTLRQLKRQSLMHPELVAR